MDLISFNKLKTTNLNEMLANSTGLTYVDMSSFDTLNCQKFDDLWMLWVNGCIKARSFWNLFSIIPDYVQVINVIIY